VTVIAGRWVLERRLDAGGAGEVWLARDQAGGGVVAVKLAASAAAPPPWPAHRSLVRVLAHGMEAGRRYVVMPLVPGRTLAALLAEGPLAPALARRIADGIAEALAALRDAGLAHGDLTPANVIIGEDGAVTLVDPEPIGGDDAAAFAALSARLGVF
jgi:serine/threonine-protein kinase